MRFIVQEEVFNKLESLCFGVVVAKGIDNKTTYPKIDDLFTQSMEKARQYFANTKIKEHETIIPYREAFLDLGFNPNKFLCSIEALVTRIAKGAQLPHINNVVDLANAISLQYILPIGAHDLDKLQGDLTVRYSVQGDVFVPFGMTEAESLEPGELVYVSGNQVKTRKWIWRQSEEGKITAESSKIFFPIDGFKGINKEAVLAARDELARLLAAVFNCEIKRGFIDRDNMEMEL